MMLLVAMLLAGCGYPWGEEDGNEAASFPHPSGFVFNHGPTYQEDPSSCASCHDQQPPSDLSGPACGSCHPTYPHADDFFMGSNHGPEWAEQGTNCALCHGADGKEEPGRKPSACVDCHSTYPHGEGWIAPTQHGQSQFHHGTTASCNNCHDSATAIPGEAPCTTCHQQYPHPDNWIQPNVHGWYGQTEPDSCGSCHTKTDPTNIVSCAQCHQAYPHSATWNKDHAAKVQAVGAATCESCHPSGSLTGPDIPVSCGPGCHGSAP